MQRSVAPMLVAPILIGVAVAGWSCRQIAGIHDIELVAPADASAPLDASDSPSASDAPADAVVDSPPPRDAATPDACKPVDAAGGCGCPCCTTLASDLETPLSLVRIGTDLYVLDYGIPPIPGSLVRVPTAGGAAETLQGNLGTPISLATDGTHLYWLGKDPEAGAGGIVAKLDIGGGADAGFTVIAAGQGAVTSYAEAPTNTQLVVEGKTAYWVDFNDIIVRSVSTAGGAKVVDFLSAFPTGLSHGKFFGPVAIQSDGTSLFVLTGDYSTTDDIIAVPLTYKPDGGTGVNVAEGIVYGSPSNLALAGSAVFYVESPVTSGYIPQCTNGTLWSASPDGGTPKYLAHGLPTPWALTVDDGFVYWVNNGGSVCMGTSPGSIMKVPVDGGTTTTLVAVAATPQAIVTDTDNVYWVDSTCGTLMKVHK